MQPSARGPALSLSKGFTLIELLIVISIIAVLSVIGIVVFTNVQKGARDAKRKADINAIAKAYEVKYNSSGSYQALTDADFASGKPKDPNSAKGDYFNWLDSTGAGFKVCASLEANPNDACNTPATNCYCMVSAQGTVNSAAADPSGSTQIGIGFGGSSSPSCDPNGTLLSGLVGYWKMDETSWNGTAGEVVDSSGNNNNGAAMGLATTATGRFGNAGSFNGSGTFLDMGNSSSLQLVGPSFTLSAWIKPNVNNVWQGVINKGIAGNDSMINFEMNSGGKVGLFFYSDDCAGTTTLTTGTWYLMVATYDASSKKQTVYLGNGSTVSSECSRTLTGTLNSVIDTKNVWIGKDYNNAVFNGLIDDVRVYNRVLSSSEISSLYNSGSGCLP